MTGVSWQAKASPILVMWGYRGKEPVIIPGTIAEAVSLPVKCKHRDDGCFHIIGPGRNFMAYRFVNMKGTLR